MAIKIRRGLDSERQGITFAEGELAFTLDLKQLWIGDGTTEGGILVAGSVINGFTDLADIPDDHAALQVLRRSADNLTYEWIDEAGVAAIPIVTAAESFTPIVSNTGAASIWTGKKWRIGNMLYMEIYGDIKEAVTDTPELTLPDSLEIDDSISGDNWRSYIFGNISWNDVSASLIYDLGTIKNGPGILRFVVKKDASGGGVFGSLMANIADGADGDKAFGLIAVPIKGWEITTTVRAAEATLADLAGVPEPVAGQFIRRNFADDAYEYVDAIVPDGRQRSVITLREMSANAGSWDATIGGELFSEPYSKAPDDYFAKWAMEDSTGLTLNGTVDFVTGRNGNAIRTDGVSGNYAETGVSVDAATSPNLHSVMGWCKYEAGKTNYLFGTGASSTGQTHLALAIGDTTVSFPATYHGGDAGEAYDTVWTHDFVDGTWHHLALVKVAVSTYEVFIDAVSHGTFTKTSTNPANINFGRWHSAGWEPFFADEIHYYKRALTQQEITDAFAETYNDKFSGATALAAQIDANPAYVAEAADAKVYVLSATATTYTLTGGTDTSVELLPREFSLESLTEVPPPVANQYLRRNAANDAYEWTDQVLYGTGDPPDPTGLPDGTIYIKY